MNIEKKEMDKDSETKLFNVFKELAAFEKELQEMNKDELINLLTIRFFEDITPFKPDNGEADLWYYMDPESGAKYITNEFPKSFLVPNSEYPMILTEGEINIRVPKLMEGMLPEAYEDGTPRKIHLTVSF